MRAKTCLAVLVGFCALVLAGAGCKNGTWGGGGSEKLGAEPQLGVSDVPIPSGFAMDEAASEDRSTGNWRYIRHVYMGKADAQVVRAFYRDQMPLTKWKMQDDEMRQGTYKLRFENDLESCVVTISRVKQAFGEKTQLMIEVSPLDRSKGPKTPRQEEK